MAVFVIADSVDPDEMWHFIWIFTVCQRTNLRVICIEMVNLESRAFYLFRNEFNKFNNTRAQMLDSIYHMTNTLKSPFWRKNVIILSLCTQGCYGRHNVSRKSINH